MNRLCYPATAVLVHAALAAALALLLFAAPAAAQEKLVVAFGDSLTAGYQLGQDEGFAPQLEDALNDSGIDARVINAGVSGDTSAGGRRRIGWTLDNLDRKPDLVIVELGANDMLRGLSPQETLRNLNAIISEIRAREIDVLLAGMLAPPNLGERNYRYFNAVYPFLANHHDIPRYPFFMRGVAFRPDRLLGDRLHPNADGVKTIVAGIMPYVTEALDEAS